MQSQIRHRTDSPATSSLHLVRFFITFLFSLSFLNASGQKIPDYFKSRVDSLAKAAPTTYSEIDTVMRVHKGDTTLMRYFANVATKKKYNRYIGVMSIVKVSCWTNDQILHNFRISSAS